MLHTAKGEYMSLIRQITDHISFRGDAQMSWQRMADVISTCSQAGVWNVSFSKQMPEAKK